MAYLSKAIDEVRVQEVKETKREIAPVLAKTDWLLFNCRESQSGKQEHMLSRLLLYNQRSIRSYLFKKSFS